MALIDEDGSGKSDAESPNSLTWLNAYHSSRGNAAWTGTDSIKEQAARRANDFMEGRYGSRLPGTRLYSTQALSFPRVDAYRRIGALADQAIEFDEVPIEWKRAHAELSLRALAGPLAPDITRSSRVSSVSVVGAVSVSWEAGAPIATSYEQVDDLLRPLLRFGAVLVRG